MKKIKLPYGVADYEKIKTGNYLYVDKTKYIEILEDNSDYIVFLRPRRFGKSLFISTLSNYYDINKEDKFEKLFGDTYIGQNPTELKNSYCILKFNFSGISTSDEDILQESFLENVKDSMTEFLQEYDLSEKVQLSSSKDAAIVANNFFTQINKKTVKPIYVLIDEYDHFANEILGFNSDIFSDIVSKNGFVRKFYEVLKKRTETSIIDKIFITGVSPITLDSMTSGFNITDSLTCDLEFHNSMGFTRDEVKELMKISISNDIYNKESENILKEMQQNYDGYKFSSESDIQIYNSDMCLYYLNNYKKYNKPPKQLLDINIASDYSKLTNLFSLKTLEDKKRNYSVLERIINGESQNVVLTSRFSFEKKFDEDDFVSLLFYLGFLTITGDKNDSLIMDVPNQTIKELYFKLFFDVLKEQYKFSATTSTIRNIFVEMAEKGKNELFIKNMETILNAMSNRDYQGMNEQFVKSIAFTLSHFSGLYLIKSEYEVNEGYIDLAYLPKLGQSLNYYSIIEFKYIKKSDYKKNVKDEIKEKREQAYNQLIRYSNAPELVELDKQGKLKKWIVIFSKDKCVLNEEIIN